MAKPEEKKGPEPLANIAKAAAEEMTRRAIANAAAALVEEKRLPENPDKESPVVTTRAQAAAVITSCARRCRGRLGSLQAPADATEDQRAAAEYELRLKIGAALQAGDEALAKALDIDTRRPCDYDFNEIVLANPLDGLEHDYQCPRCGVVGTYRAPMFPELVG
jgi:hypothetical protein